MSYLSDDTNASNSQDFKPVDEGRYLATLEDVRFDDTKEDPRISLMWRLDNNMVTWTNLIFKDTTKGIVSSALEGLGVKDAFKSQTANVETHAAASQVAFAVIGKLNGKKYYISVKHTEKSDGNGVWVNTYVNEPAEKVIANHAPQVPVSKGGFDASESVPF